MAETTEELFEKAVRLHSRRLLAIARGHTQLRRSDTLEDILSSPDRDELLHWLQAQPLFHYDAALNVALVHAGVPPQWDLPDTLAYAGEIAAVLRSEQADDFFAHMYGNKPDRWNASLQGPPRWRLITNYLTRMRFCSADGQLDLAHKEGPDTAPAGYFPWYSLPRKLGHIPLVFGHWASLEGAVDQPNLQALDTGCVWGGQLTLAEIGANFRRSSVPARQADS